jgi:hypothetical protein
MSIRFQNLESRSIVGIHIRITSTFPVKPEQSVGPDRQVTQIGRSACG